MRNTKVIVPLLAAFALAITGCTSYSSETDQMTLVYDDYAIFPTDPTFEECASSNTTVTYWNVSAYTYPVKQRTYDFTGGKGSEARPIEVTDKDGVKLTVPGIMTFSLDSTVDKNGDCPKIKQFHENIGRKFLDGESEWTRDKWVEMLNAYVGSPLKTALEQAAQKYTWRQLILDQEVRQAWQAEVGKEAREGITSLAGAEFFCAPIKPESGCGNFTLNLEKPQAPDSISKALEQTQAELEKKNQADKAKNRIDAEAESLKALVELFGRQGAILYKAIEEGKVQIVPVPSGGNLNITPR